MLKEKKTEIVAWLEEALSHATTLVVTDYRGLSASNMTQLRRRLREQGVEYHVVKNTLLRLAAVSVGKPGLTVFLEGPTAIALGKDEVAPVRALSDFVRTSKLELRIKGGMLGSRVFQPNEVTLIATLPSREQLVARLLGEMKLPISSLVRVLNANLRGLAVVLQGRIEQLEKAESTSAA